MTKVALVTGGAGGMGLATAKVLGKDHHVVISDVNQERLEAAVCELKLAGVSCDAMPCDISDSHSVETLIRRSVDLGKLVAVIHTAGISPQMSDPLTIMRVNALGTVNVTKACHEVASEGFALINVASVAAHMVPALLLPRRAYRLAFIDPVRFLTKALFPSRLMPTRLYRNGMAYGISKDFVVWLCKAYAAKFGAKGARILSVSPGVFDTEMGRLEEKSGAADMLRTTALKRYGKPEEVAELLAFCASEKAGYLTGTDVLCDGGVMAGRECGTGTPFS